MAYCSADAVSAMILLGYVAASWIRSSSFVSFVNVIVVVLPLYHTHARVFYIHRPVVLGPGMLHTIKQKFLSN